MSLQIKIIAMIAISLSACKKDKPMIPEVASVNIINAAVNAGTVQVNYFGKPLVWKNYTGNEGKIDFAANKVYTFPSGNYPLTIVRQVDTLNPVFNRSINASPGEIFSLYLTGQTSPYEYLLVKENSGSSKIGYLTDSVLNVRVINLSPNSPPVNVTLSTSTTVNEFSNLSFGQSSDFKNYSANATGSISYTFQIRNANTNAIISTSAVSKTTYRFKNITLVFRGMVGSTPAAGVTIVRNY